MQKGGRFKRTIKKVGKRVVNPAWFNKTPFINFAQNIKKVFWTVFDVKASSQVESFEQAKQRHGLSDAKINKQMQASRNLSYTFLLGALGVLAYSIYSLYLREFLSFIATFGIAMAMFGFAFKFHFWYFQLKNRHLGYSLQEWWDYGVLGKQQTNNKRIEKQ